MIVKRVILPMIISLVAMQESNELRSNSPRFRVVQGRNADINEYPFVVSILGNILSVPGLIRICTGSLITSQFVITAAHCTVPKLQYVRCGNMSVLLNETICKSKILRHFTHPGAIHMKRRANNDIGLIQVTPLVMKHYGLLQAVDYKTLLGRPVRYAGYGKMVATFERDAKNRTELQRKPLQIGEGVIYNTCQEKSFTFEFGASLLVAPKCFRKDQHIFQGDSGAPLFLGRRIVGVACGGSSFHVMNKQHHPVFSVFTPVSPYLEWITLIINKY